MATKCTERVYRGGRFESLRGRPCGHYAIEGTTLCAIHSPDATAKRQAAADERREAEMRTRQSNARRQAETMRRAAAYPCMVDALRSIIELQAQALAGAEPLAALNQAAVNAKAAIAEAGADYPRERAHG